MANFQVFDNNRPADCRHCAVGKDWNKSCYPTFKEAYAYAEQWLGDTYKLPDNWDGSPFNYSGYGDTIEIRKVSVKIPDHLRPSYKVEEDGNPLQTLGPEIVSTRKQELVSKQADLDPP